MERVSADDLDWTDTERDGTNFRRKRLAAAAGADDLGCSLYELPPGGTAWPYHYHAGNEEAIYVLSGSGTLRHDGETRALAAGDYVAFPAGPGSAHRVVNDSEGPLRYLALSTMDDPDVLVYPDSGKVGVYAGSAPGREAGRERTQFFPEDAAVDFWEGEVGDADPATGGGGDPPAAGDERRDEGDST